MEEVGNGIFTFVEIKVEKDVDNIEGNNLENYLQEKPKDFKLQATHNIWKGNYDSMLENIIKRSDSDDGESPADKNGEQLSNFNGHNNTNLYTEDHMYNLNLTNMNRDVRIYANRKTHICNVCGKNFKNKSKLRVHINNYNHSTKSYTCNCCGQNFKYKSYLENHIRRQEEYEKILQTFAKKSSQRVDKSELVHKIDEDVKPYTCTCGAKFTRFRNLEGHIKVQEKYEKILENFTEGSSHKRVGSSHRAISIYK